MSRYDEMLTLYNEGGLTYQEIADRYGVTRQRVQQLIGNGIKAAHYGRAKKERRREQMSEVHRAITGGVTTVEREADKLGIKPESLVESLRRLGLKFPRKESPLHGTYYRYSRGCRCPECKAGQREYFQQMKLREPPRHGTASAYRNYACRCDLCRAAGSDDNRRTRLRRILRERERMPNE